MLIKIPETMSPYVVTINGKKHIYESGTEQDVPEDVYAYLISQGAFPPARKEPEPPFAGLPKVTSADDGKVMTVVGGNWQAEAMKNATGVTF